MVSLRPFKRLAEDADAFIARDPAANRRLDVILVYPGFHALTLHRAAHRLWNGRFQLLARGLAYFARWLTGIEIHPAATSCQRLVIDHGMCVVIGLSAAIGLQFRRDDRRAGRLHRRRGAGAAGERRQMLRTGLHGLRHAAG